MFCKIRWAPPPRVSCGQDPPKTAAYARADLIGRWFSLRNGQCRFSSTLFPLSSIIMKILRSFSPGSHRRSGVVTSVSVRPEPYLGSTTCGAFRRCRGACLISCPSTCTGVQKQPTSNRRRQILTCFIPHASLSDHKNHSSALTRVLRARIERQSSGRRHDNRRKPEIVVESGAAPFKSERRAAERRQTIRIEVSSITGWECRRCLSPASTGV